MHSHGPVEIRRLWQRLAQASNPPIPLVGSHGGVQLPDAEVETHQEFETADSLAHHLPWDLEIFTEDVFMHETHCPRMSERFKDLCAGGMTLCFS